jgi:iron complex outermembrane receptor protein
MMASGKICKRIGKTLNFMSFTLLVLFNFIFFPFQLNCQDITHNDTVKISEVIISRKNTKELRPFYSGVPIDSSAFQISNNKSIANLISENTNISFKSYGSGGAATISIRGTGAGHTRLDWNGISINNPMLGQSDFSLIPVSAADEISILYGSSSMINGNGGIGGIISLETKPVWSDESSVSVSAGAGSFGNYSGTAAIRTGNMHFQSCTKAFFNNSENDFRYLNTETDATPSWETMKENRVRSSGLIQEMYYRGEKSLLSARIWYQSANRELPYSMLTRQPGLHEKQNDESFRTMVSYNLKQGKSDISLTGAWLTDNLDYLNNLASIDSRNRAETMVIKAGIENNITHDFKISFSINEELNIIKSNNYENIISRNIATLTGSAEKSFSKQIRAIILFREILDKETLLIPDFSAGVHYRIMEDKDFVLKASVSRNSKIPSLNDLYWYPGGNRDLKNEYATQYEMAYEMAGKPAGGLSYYFDIEGFRYNIQNMVLWRPGANSYWTADNIQNVNSSGIETSLRLIYKVNHFYSRLNGGYSYTRAVSHTDGNASSNFQMAYIPVSQAYSSLFISLGKFYSVWNCNLTGRRYLTSDNSHYLHGYLLNNITAGAKLAGRGRSFDVSFSADNIFNQSYQAIAHYPMPGRAYFLKLTLNITK